MLSLVHLIYMAGDKCMRQNACFLISSLESLAVYRLTSGSYSAIVHWIGCINAIKLQV